MPNPTRFSLLTAFTNSINGGNPAAIVFTDMNRSVESFKDIAENFNQPITTFLSSSPVPTTTENAVAFDARFFTAHRQELPLCGHGSLAASKAIFGDNTFVDEATEVVEFKTLTHGTLSARQREAGFFEIELPTTIVRELPPDEKARISNLLNCAFGRELKVNFIGTGSEGFEIFEDGLIELDAKEDVKSLRLQDPSQLKLSGFPGNVVTSRSLTGNEAFVSRLFAPGYVQNDEDPVCGSAHCVLAPYWYPKLKISNGQSVTARAVSPRGGELGLTYDADKATLKLRGQVTELGKGELVA
ncbi:hypothetical protein H0H87_006466 [Tephrocybe sp. NHM501043]|nr:hypothetical protein H0H87_006466 [Tephrocybe sp. NHM501043]